MPAVLIDETGNWVWKRGPVYCRPHGLRIVGFINGVGCCQRCTSDALDELETLSEDYGTEDWCRCYQKVGEEPHICERHSIMLEGQ